MLRFCAGLAVATLATGCASTSATSASNDGAYDPIEPFNRKVYAFNEAADRAVIGPAADAYVAVTPKVARTGISNALANLNSPVVFVNDILQGEFLRAGDTTYRFLMNSTIGLAGLFDVASEFGVEGHSEDFGQTLAVWGVNPGPYIVLPLLGPSNLRDTTGFVTDIAFDPLTWSEIDNDQGLTDAINYTALGLGVFDTRVALDDQLETLREQTEPYIALRRIYSSQRKAEIRNGVEEDDPYTDLPDFDDFE